MFCKEANYLSVWKIFSSTVKHNKGIGLVESHIVNWKQKLGLKAKTLRRVFFPLYHPSPLECKFHESRDSFPLPIIFLVPSIVPGME